MAKHGKKRQEAIKAIDVDKAYPITEAIALLKKQDIQSLMDL